jgi:two-component system, OmpR family, sensor kinase
VSLSRRLTLIAVASSAFALTVLILAFNLILDARLRSDADNVLRERATSALRVLGTVNGRLSVLEAPDQGAIDAQTWIFAGASVLEQPAGADRRNQRAVMRLAGSGASFATVQATDTRLYAIPARAGGRRLGTVVVAGSLTAYQSTASSALLGSVILGVLTLLAIAALSRWLISHALRPVARMTAQAAAWSERDLSRRFFTGEPRDELSSLAAVFDRLLARVAQGFRREQRLTAEISHELRTPLAKIVTEAELAAGRERSAEQYRAALQQITHHAEHMQGVLETLLATARATPGGRHLSDAREAVQRSADALATASDGKVIAIRCPLPVLVAVESNVLERILSPLLENAARHAAREITVEISASGGEALIAIHDDGPGLARGERERIFEPGYQGQAPHAERGGAGLGLPLARRLARAAGGDVEARPSERGGSFAVRLPIADRNPLEASAP